MDNNDLRVNLNYFKKIKKSNIIKFIAMTASSSLEKQMLLETTYVKEFFENLITLLQYNNIVGSGSINQLITHGIISDMFFEEFIFFDNFKSVFSQKISRQAVFKKNTI